MNPLALGLIALGIVFLLFGIFSFAKGKKITGIILSTLGIIAIASPFAISYFLTR
jgi:hypothetical protein